MKTLEEKAGLLTLQEIASSRMLTIVAKSIVGLFVLLPFALAFVPWQQFITAKGNVVAFDPNERRQLLKSPVEGRIGEWFVQEASQVQAGDPLVRIEDIDPNRLFNLQQQRAAYEAERRHFVNTVEDFERQIDNLMSARDAKVATAEFKFETAQQKVRESRERLAGAEATRIAIEGIHGRVKRLRPEGITSQQELEIAQAEAENAQRLVNSWQAVIKGAEADVKGASAEIDQVKADFESKVNVVDAKIQDARGKAQKVSSELAKLSTDIARQESQLIVAPRPGVVHRLAATQASEIVKKGDVLLELVPDTERRAVQLFVDGNDAPLLSPGRRVRLQFEGWPAVQFAGWPSVAVGTFGGEVAFIDPTDDGNGKFRIMVSPDENDEPWPSPRWLRQGVQTKGWVLLNQVSLGYELWRQLNAFPPVIAAGEPNQNAVPKRKK